MKSASGTVSRSCWWSSRQRACAISSRGRTHVIATVETVHDPLRPIPLRIVHLARHDCSLPLSLYFRSPACRFLRHSAGQLLQRLHHLHSDSFPITRASGARNVSPARSKTKRSNHQDLVDHRPAICPTSLRRCLASVIVPTGQVIRQSPRGRQAQRPEHSSSPQDSCGCNEERRCQILACGKTYTHGTWSGTMRCSCCDEIEAVVQRVRNRNRR